MTARARTYLSPSITGRRARSRPRRPRRPTTINYNRRTIYEFENELRPKVQTRHLSKKASYRDRAMYSWSTYFYSLDKQVLKALYTPSQIFWQLDFVLKERDILFKSFLGFERPSPCFTRIPVM